jgi:site-specific recombinase XerD
MKKANDPAAAPVLRIVAGGAPGLPFWIDRFLEDRETAGASRHTIANYRADLHALARDVGADADLRTLDADDLRSHFRGLAERDLSVATRARHFASVSAFLGWAVRQDLIAASPIAKLEPPKKDEPPPRAIPDADWQRLQQAVVRAEPRDRLLWTLLMETGLRVSEALGLYTTDVFFSPGQDYLRVLGKGGSWRHVPLLFEHRCRRLLQAELRAAGRERQPLFRTGKDGSRRMGYRTAVYRWRHLLRAAGLGEAGYTIHQMRHTVATGLVNDGVSITAVRRLLGHKNLQTTQRYAELSDAATRRELEEHARRTAR